LKDICARLPRLITSFQEFVEEKWVKLFRVNTDFGVVPKSAALYEHIEDDDAIFAKILSEC
jgi:hypothetical protein